MFSKKITESKHPSSRLSSFDDLLKHDVFEEAISLKNAKRKKYSKKYSGAYGDNLNKIFDNKNRIFSKIKIDYSNIKSPLMDKINYLIDKHDYIIPDVKTYIDGFAYKYKITNTLEMDKKNPIKIGKLLQKYEPDGTIQVTKRVNGEKTKKSILGKPLLHEFKNDPIRSSNGEFAVVISRHPYDIAGSSTDRSWTSCMDLGFPRINYTDKSPNTGENRRYVQRDIDEGTLVAYVVTMDELYKGPNGEQKVKLQRPLSRILIKPHGSSPIRFYTVGSTYGSKYPEFTEKIKDWVLHNLNKEVDENESIYRNRSLYNDGGTDTPVGFKFNEGNDIADKVMKDVLSDNNYKQLGNNITFESRPAGYTYIMYNINIKMNFNKDIVPRIDEIIDVHSYSVKDISSNFESMIASSIFDVFDSGRYGPRISLTVDSITNGIEIKIEFSVQTYDDEQEKYVDNDLIEDNLYHSIEFLKEFDYNELKSDLYKICSEYDWEKDANDRKNLIRETLNVHKQVLMLYTPIFKNSGAAIQSLNNPITPEELLKSDVPTIEEYYNIYSKILTQLNQLIGFIETHDRSLKYAIVKDEQYKGPKHEIHYNWFKDMFDVDLLSFKEKHWQAWSISNLMNLKNSIEPSADVWEAVMDIKYTLSMISNKITNLIGDHKQLRI
jgi:hypothetical protein